MLLLALTAGCDAAIVDDTWEGGVFFAISGPIDVPADSIGSEPRGAIAWAWLLHGRISGRVEEAGFEPRVYSYALDVDHPPTVDPNEGEPAGWAGWAGSSLLVGLPLLYRPEDEAHDLQVIPEALFAWLSGDETDANAVVVPGSGDMLAAVTRDHLIVGLAGDPPGPPGHGAPCGLDAAVAGLTLYRRGDGACAAWQPLADPGERTEFQGVPMGPPGPPP